MTKKSKNSTGKNDFYQSIISYLKVSTNLTDLRKKLGISKQSLNYYLCELKKNGLIVNKSSGLWEVVKESKNSTKYGSFLPKDFIRGHAYVIEIKLPKNIPNWDKRIEILEKSKINYKLVGALKNTPRIKVMGRKVWLCNDHLRIFDRKDESYYGNSAVEGRKQAFWTFYKIIGIIENKFGINLKPIEFEWKKEHYALIKNDLAIDQNQKGVIWRISDESGEWLLIDDSLEKGGELENTGKEAFKVSPKLQNWWNDNKNHDFELTVSKTLELFNEQSQITQNLINNQQVTSEQIAQFGFQLERHLEVLGKIGDAIDRLSDEVSKIKSNRNI